MKPRIRLERRSRLPGYCIVIWSRGHVAEPTELDSAAAGEYWADLLAVSRAIESEFQPVKINLLTLGNWVPHLHTHVVPRYTMTLPRADQIPWTDIFNEEPTPPDVLRRQAASLRARPPSTC